MNCPERDEEPKTYRIRSCFFFCIVYTISEFWCGYPAPPWEVFGQAPSCSLSLCLGCHRNSKGYDLFTFDLPAAYLHRWLSAIIYFNRYNLCFHKYTECRDKSKLLYFMVLHIRVVLPLFSHFVECPLSDTMCWMIGYFHRYVTECLLNTKVVVFLGFLWFVVGLLHSEYLIRLKKCRIVLIYFDICGSEPYYIIPYLI